MAVLEQENPFRSRSRAYEDLDVGHVIKGWIYGAEKGKLFPTQYLDDVIEQTAGGGFYGKVLGLIEEMC